MKHAAIPVMRFSRRRSGISYILEVVMMTLVITALASVVLAWGLTAVSNSRTAITGAVNSRMNRLQETVVIEDVQMINTNTLRVFVTNAGSIQMVIDQVYVNNVGTIIVGVCPTGSFQGSNANVAGSTGSLTISLSTAEPDTNYIVSVATGWATTVTVGSKTTTSFVLTFGTNSPGAGSTLTWSTNYNACPAGTKLSVSIQGSGALDVTVPPSVTLASGSVSTATGTTLTDNSRNWQSSQWVNDLVTITGGTGASATSRTITANTASTLTVSSWPNGTPDSTSQYTISCPSGVICGGASYLVQVASTRGTTFQSTFTV